MTDFMEDIVDPRAAGILAALRHHFPDASGESLREEARGIWVAASWGHFKESAAAKPVGTEEAMKRLAEAEAAAEALHTALVDLPIEAFSALLPCNEAVFGDPTWHDDLAWDLVKLVESLSAAQGEMAAGPQTAKPRYRRRPKTAELFAAVATAYAYEKLSGKAATVITDPVTKEARGGYLALLADVFKARGIVASVEARGRAALKVKNTPD